MVPLYAEEFGNIHVLRAAITSCLNVAENLKVENSILKLNNAVVADLSTVGVSVSADKLVVVPSSDNDWEIKLTLSQAPSQLRSQQTEIKEWWTSKSLLDGNATSKKQFSCLHCDAALIDASVEYKIKDLPSEHWYELVECWICHETKPEEHQARMRPILAKTDVLLVGTTYFLMHVDNMVKDSIQADSVVLERANWDRGTLTKWISIQCKQCQHVIGEGQYCKEQQELQLLALKLFKYSINLLPAMSQRPTFVDYFVSDLVNTAKIHATYRYLVQGRQSQRIYALIWLFNWDTHVIYNNGYNDTTSKTLRRDRVMKVIYLDCTMENNTTRKYIEMWSNDKSTDHLIYPDDKCLELVNTLNKSTDILPPFMRIFNHPAMIFTKQFSIGFIRRAA